MATAAEKKTAPPERPVWGFGEPKVLEIPPEAHTYSGFLNWVMSTEVPEKLRVTFLGGQVILDMTEEAIDTHVAVKGAVYHTLLGLVTEEDFGEFYTDGVLIGNESAGVSNNPDAVAVSWKTFEQGRVTFVERKGMARAVEGSPDWVLEIISDSSVGKDTKRLREAYHRAGITEYWLIDARKEEIQFHILTWQHNGYHSVPAKEGWLYSKVFRRAFRLTRSRNRVGRWKYTLAVRSEGPKTKSRT